MLHPRPWHTCSAPPDTYCTQKFILIMCSCLLVAQCCSCCLNAAQISVKGLTVSRLCAQQSVLPKLMVYWPLHDRAHNTSYRTPDFSLYTQSIPAAVAIQLLTFTDHKLQQGVVLVLCQHCSICKSACQPASTLSRVRTQDSATI